MAIRNSTIKTTFSVVLTALLLAACGGESPEAMLASARGYLAKNDGKAAVIQLKNALQTNPDLAEARFLLGRTLLDGGDLIAADIELRKAKELKYSADQVMPLLARAQLLLGQPKKVIDDFSGTQLSSTEAKADLQTSIGQAHLMLGKVDDANRAFDSALAADPGYGLALVGQARIMAGKRDFSTALPLLDSALAKKPDLVDAWKLKGDVLYAKGDTAGSTDAFRKALDIKPDDLPAHVALISRYMEDGKLDDAGRLLQNMKKLAPKHPQTSYLQALYFYRQKDFKAAQENMQQFLKVLPESSLGLQLAGAIEYELKSYRVAETYLLKALPNSPDLGVARRLLITTYLSSNQPTRALTALQPILGKIDSDSNMLALAGEVFMQNGDTEKAAAYFNRSSVLDPENSGKKTSLAISHLAKGQTEIAHRELEAIASGGTDIKADMALISSYLAKRDFDQTLKAIAALEKKQPENPLVPHLRGLATLGKGDIAGARAQFEQALLKKSDYYPAAASLVNLDLAEKKPEAARQRLEQVVVKDPKNMQAMLALAQLRANLGAKPDEVAEIINRAILANPAEILPRLALIDHHLVSKEAKKALSAAQDAVGVFPDRPEILDALGRAQQAEQDFNQALITYGKLAGLLPGSPQPYLRMAEIHLAAKDRDAAMASLQKALSVKPDSIDAQKGVVLLNLGAGKTSDALKVAREMQKQRPKDAVGYTVEGDIHAFGKSWTEAATAYRAGLKQADAAELAAKLHGALLAGGNTGEANKFADGWLSGHAKDPKFRMYLAETASVRGDYALASKHYRVMLDAQPNNSVILNNLAWTSAQTKDPKAIEYAQMANKLAPEQPAYMDTLGVLLVAKGEKGQGIALLKKALALAPQQAAIRLNLAKALVQNGDKAEAKKELDELAKIGDKFPAHKEVEELLKGL